MNKPRISAIAAISKNRALGKDNKLLFHIPEDMKYFREMTRGHPVIMGSKTFESIGKVLPGRLNIVLTIEKNFKAPGATVVFSPEEALEIAKETGDNEIFIIGGGQIYKLFLPLTDRLYLTLVDRDVSGDTYFPDYSEFMKVVSEESGEYEDLNYKFLVLEK